jgi:sugar O-acyltransferase (sialic acid O-acetyltransferase NeuD family)
MKKIIIIGSGEHAKIVIENILEQELYEPFGMVSFDTKDKNKKYFGCKVVCTYKNLKNFIKRFKGRYQFFFIIGIGTLKGKMKIREKIFNEVKRFMKPINIINPKSHISKYSKIGQGNLVEAFAKIGAGAKVGNNCVIESYSSVNHDQKIGNNVFIATNVAFAGSIIGKNSLICDGAVISFKKKIGSNCIVFDGSVLTGDLESNTFFFNKNYKTKKIPIFKYLEMLKTPNEI